MRIIKPSFEWLGERPNGEQLLHNIASAARVCYQSDGTQDAKLIKGCILRGHESVIEHEKLSVLVVCDRGVSHEIVRHRVGSYSQESTRYCNYSKKKFGSELTFIAPWWAFDEDKAELFSEWQNGCKHAENAYIAMLAQGATPEMARAVLPNSLKTQIAITYNLREWRHFFRLRCDERAHPDIRVIAKMLLKEFNELMPEVFGDLWEVHREV